VAKRKKGKSIAKEAIDINAMVDTQMSIVSSINMNATSRKRKSGT